MNEYELGIKARRLLESMEEYSEAELRRRLADEQDIVTFTATMIWFISHTTGREDLSPFEWMIWERIVWAIVHYWNPIDLGCPI
jgi:hypothetical protein